MDLALRLLEKDGLSYRAAAGQLGVSVSTLHKAGSGSRYQLIMAHYGLYVSRR